MIFIVIYFLVTYSKPIRILYKLHELHWTWPCQKEFQIKTQSKNLEVIPWWLITARLVLVFLNVKKFNNLNIVFDWNSRWLVSYVDMLCMRTCRPTLDYSASSSTRTSACRSTRRRLSSCTKVASVMKCRRTSTPSPTRLTVICCKVCNIAIMHAYATHTNTAFPHCPNSWLDVWTVCVRKLRS